MLLIKNALLVYYRINVKHIVRALSAYNYVILLELLCRESNAVPLPKNVINDC